MNSERYLKPLFQAGRNKALLRPFRTERREETLLTFFNIINVKASHIS